MEPIKVIDKVGNEIKEGSFIVYGHALGRCAGLRIGKVLKIRVLEKPNYAPVGVGSLYRITVKSVDDDWSYREITLNPRTGTLMFPDRIIVLLPEQIPAIYRDLLN